MKRVKTRKGSAATIAKPPQRGRVDKHRTVAVLVERGAVAIERVLSACSAQEIQNLLATINEVEYPTMLSTLAVQNLDSEPLGLRIRTTADRRRIKLVRRLAWLMDTRNVGRKRNETRLAALLRYLDRKSDSELERMIHKLEAGYARA